MNNSWDALHRERALDYQNGSSTCLFVWYILRNGSGRNQSTVKRKLRTNSVNHALWYQSCDLWLWWKTIKRDVAIPAFVIRLPLNSSYRLNIWTDYHWTLPPRLGWCDFGGENRTSCRTTPIFLVIQHALFCDAGTTGVELLEFRCSSFAGSTVGTSFISECLLRWRTGSDNELLLFTWPGLFLLIDYPYLFSGCNCKKMKRKWVCFNIWKWRLDRKVQVLGISAQLLIGNFLKLLSNSLVVFIILKTISICLF